MVDVRPFKALRPAVDLAEQVAAPPYDVVSLSEARALAADNALSFLRISRAELELPDDVDPYSEAVYEHGAKTLQRLINEGTLVREPSPVFALYRQRMGDHTQTGLVALASVADYDAAVIKKHELTRPTKEDDRVRLIKAHDSQSGPVFLLYRDTEELAAIRGRVTATSPDFAFTSHDEVEHEVWTVRKEADLAAIGAAFDALEALYIADGHHRSAAASRVHRELADDGGTHDGFLSVLFPDTELQILPYNRLVRDLNGLTPEGFVEALEVHFVVAPTDAPGTPEVGGFDFYLGTWQTATPRDGVVPSDPVGALSVSVLSDRVLEPLLGIVDQRTSNRIHFVGGIRGTGALSDGVDSGEFAVAFAVHPTTVAQLLEVADADQIMPPKSTWFEPKLKDGLFIHMFR